MKIAVISGAVAQILSRPQLQGTGIYLGETNILHMKTSHPDDYAKYKDELSNILNHPDYVGINPKDNSIEYVKEFLVENEYVKVAVRISTKGQYYARSLYVLNNRRTENFIKKGTLKKVDISEN